MNHGISLPSCTAPSRPALTFISAEHHQQHTLSSASVQRILNNSILRVAADRTVVHSLSAFPVSWFHRNLVNTLVSSPRLVTLLHTSLARTLTVSVSLDGVWKKHYTGVPGSSWLRSHRVRVPAPCWSSLPPTPPAGCHRIAARRSIATPLIPRLTTPRFHSAASETMTWLQ